MRLIKKLKSIWQKEGDTPLPIKQFSPIFVLFIVNGMVITTVFSYLPQLIKSFGISEVDTGRKVGLIASSLFIARAIFCLAWGLLADKIGKKIALYLSAGCLMISTFMFGLSKSYEWLFVWRFAQGSSSGLIVITKSIVGDLCDDTNLTTAFSILFSGFQVGIILGPSLAGYLSFPALNYPSVFKMGSFWDEYAVFIPNTILFVLFIPTTIACAILLPAEKKSTKNDEILLVKNEDQNSENNNPAEENFIAFSVEEKRNENTPLIPTKKTLWQKLKNSQLGVVLRSRNVLLCSFLYGFYSLMSIGLEEIFPVVLATSTKYRGFSMSAVEIGNVMLTVGVFMFFSQLAAMSFVIQKIGIKRCYVLCHAVVAVFFPLIPLTALIENSKLRWLSMVSCNCLIQFCISVCFTIVNVLLNNASDPETIGTVNGLAMSVSSMGRAIGPIVYGAAYSWSLKNIKTDALGFPFNEYFVFFINSFLCVLLALYIVLIPNEITVKRTKESASEDSIPLRITWSEVKI